MYWDEQRQRYFPASSRPLGAPVSATTQPLRPVADAASRSTSRRSRNRRNGIYGGETAYPPESEGQRGAVSHWKTVHAVNDGLLYGQRRRTMHDLQVVQLSRNSVEHVPYDTGVGLPRTHDFPFDLGSTISTMCTMGDTGEDGMRLWLGDATGWLYKVDAVDPFCERHYYLGTPITSIMRSGQITLVTSLGSPARMLVNRAQSAGLWLLREFPPNVCNDVRCGQVCGRAAAVGGRQGPMYFFDAEQDQFVRWKGKSDTFSLCFQDQNLLYIGMRSGKVGRWDLRQPNTHPDTVINMSEKDIQIGGAPVQHLRLIHQYGMLVETMRGDLEVHDLRFLQGATPMLQFQGHVSSYEQKPGLTIDPSEDFLFAGGGDCRLRVWSLRTGRRVASDVEGPSAASSTSPFHKIYPSPICAMEILKDEQQTYLVMGSGTYLRRIGLGPLGLLR
ncbi:hypothetical protein BD413DRAFT_560053 [Trametes elegans]|nr:hypothetical protein BD413DRAFT_560053 [Trametes elegans]